MGLLRSKPYNKIYIFSTCDYIMEHDNISSQEINFLKSPEINELVIQEKKFENEKSKSEEELTLIDVLKIFSPGTPMRTALDDIMRARMGALIVIDKEGILDIIEGGFKINCEFTPQKIVELSKMDGAIILSDDLKRILQVNTLLLPSIDMKTTETGTRHKAAERTSKQIKTIVIAVSERKNKITLYWKGEKYNIGDASEILRRATETLQILEKQKETFDDALSHLNVLEITNLATISDICNILQRIEIIKKISDIVKRYLVELGKEGLIVNMRLKELTKNLDKERRLILTDYFGYEYSNEDEILRNMNFDFLLETSNISRILFGELHDKPISPKGLRILSKTSLLEKDIHFLIDNFQTLDKVFEADENALSIIIKNKDMINLIVHSLESLREKIISGKKI